MFGNVHNRAQVAIDATWSLIFGFGFCMTLPEISNKDDTHFAEMAKVAAAGGLDQGYLPLDAQAVTEIYQASMTPGLH